MRTAINPVTNRIDVMNPGSSSVTVINSADRSIQAGILVVSGRQSNESNLRR